MKSAHLLVVVAFAGLVVGCLSRSTFPCQRDSQCVNASQTGTCEPSGVCSFPDPQCPLGRRFGHHAGPSSEECLRLQCPANPIVAIKAGAAHACFLRRDGQLWCWGRNDQGQAAQKNPWPVPAATIVPDLRGALSFATGLAHTCAQTATGVSCFGALGVSTPVPTVVANLGSTDELAAGSGFSCARVQGRVLCWGAGDKGQLGDVALSSSSIPVAVPSLDDAVHLSVGYDQACAIRTTGQITCWGDDGDDNKNPRTIVGPSDLGALALGSRFACGLSATGKIHCWGQGALGQRGDGLRTPDRLLAQVQLRQPATLVRAGRQHACAILKDSTVQCWGDNVFGQLGEGTTLSSSIPVPVLGLRDVIDLTLGDSFGCALRRDRSLLCWGDNHHGQLAAGPLAGGPQPVILTLPGDVTNLAAGGDTSCAVLATGAVTCWGDNAHGQLTDGTRDSRATPKVVRLPAAALETRLGDTRACARSLDRRLWCWGGSDLSAPSLYDGLFALDGFSVGAAHVCVATRGQAFCFGSNDQGQSGLPALSEKLPLSRVPDLQGVVEIAAGRAHTCARFQSGDVSCWGDRSFGQVGDGLQEGVAAPTPVRLSEPALSIHAGRDHSCSVGRDTGSLECWGRGDQGQLGWGSLANRALPVRVPGTGPVTALSAGASHTCVLGPGGRVLCFGAGAKGQLGRAEIQSLSPEPVPDLSGVRALGAGTAHTCVLVANSVRCFGADEWGQLGSGRDLLQPQARLVPLSCPR